MAVPKWLATGITGDTVASTDVENVSMANVMAMLLFDVVLYGFLAWYAGNTVPSEWGTHRPWYFIFQPSFWSGCFRCTSGTGSGDGAQSSTATPLDVEAREGASDSIEVVAPSLLRQVAAGECVALRNLRKTYTGADGQEVAAVKELSMTMYRGQITALLGHNGAGKDQLIRDSVFM
jgi:ATP-binding cassette subfamily A (ABC1) protein 3